MDRLQSMRVFAKVVELGSFARAAQQLEMSNAVVTRYVADLESHLGTRLLNRTTRSLSLTDAGESYPQRCQQILEDVDEAESLVTARSQSLSGTLRLIAPVMFGLHLLPEMLARFQKQYPDMVFDVLLSDRIVDIVEEGRDRHRAVGLLPGLAPAARPLLSAEIIPVPRPATCASTRHCATRRISPTTAASAAPAQRGARMDPVRAGREVTVPIRPGLLCSNAELAHQAALADMGVAMLSSYLARPMWKRGA